MAIESQANIKCRMCGKSFADKESLKEHLKEEITEIDRLFEIDTEENSHAGKEDVEDINIQPESISEGDDDDYFDQTGTCKTCGKKLADKKSYRRHSNQFHTKKEQFSCVTCAKIFYRSDYLKQHQESHKQNGTDFRCDICGVTFATSSRLENHNAIHTKKDQYKCNVCGKVCYRPNLLYQHQLIHKGRVKCETCDKTFATKANLAKHCKTVHMKEKPYGCNVCAKMFYRSDHLTQHRKSHFYGKREKVTKEKD